MVDIVRAVVIAGAVLVVVLPVVAGWFLVRTHRRYDRWDK